MIQVKTIVCHVDFSSLSANVLAAAVGLARGFGARVLAAAAVPLPGVRSPGYLLPDSDSAIADVDYAQAAQQLEELVRSTPHRGVPIEACPISGHPAGALVSLVTREQAGLLLVACPGSRPLLAPLDRFLERLYRHSPCPVLNLNSAAVARESGGELPLARAGGAEQKSPRTAPRILVATVLEPPSESAVLAAILLSRHYLAELTILHVTERRQEALIAKFGFWQFLANFSSEAQALLSSSVCPEWLKPQPRMLLVEGARDRGIIETVGHLAADLLVIGARRPPLGMPLWPSLASRMAAGAPCPVLVVGGQTLPNVAGGLERAARRSTFAAAS